MRGSRYGYCSVELYQSALSLRRCCELTLRIRSIFIEIVLPYFPSKPTVPFHAFFTIFLTLCTRHISKNSPHSFTELYESIVRFLSSQFICRKLAQLCSRASRRFVSPQIISMASPVLIIPREIKGAGQDKG